MQYELALCRNIDQKTALWATLGLQAPSWHFRWQEASNKLGSPAQWLGARTLQPECRVQTPALLLTGCAALAKLLNLSVPTVSVCQMSSL